MWEILFAVTLECTASISLIIKWSLIETPVVEYETVVLGLGVVVPKQLKILGSHFIDSSEPSYDISDSDSSG